MRGQKRKRKDQALKVKRELERNQGEVKRKGICTGTVKYITLILGE